MLSSWHIGRISNCPTYSGGNQAKQGFYNAIVLVLETGFTGGCNYSGPYLSYHEMRMRLWVSQLTMPMRLMIGRSSGRFSMGR